MSAPQNTLLIAREIGLARSQGHWWSGNRSKVQILNTASLQVRRGTTLALVGQSGAGKSTLVLCLAGLAKPDSGQIWFEGKQINFDDKLQLRKLRNSVQILFQDALRSLSPYLTATELIEEPLLIQNVGDRHSRAKTAMQLLDWVELPAFVAGRRSNQLSGGQRQRIAIARALALDTKLLILDEPFNGLDISTRSQIANLLTRIRRERSLTYIYIGHDLALVRYLADEVAMMDRGRIVEQGGTQVFFSQAHSAFGKTGREFGRDFSRLRSISRAGA